jgi:hypothetical protein
MNLPAARRVQIMSRPCDGGCHDPHSPARCAYRARRGHAHVGRRLKPGRGPPQIHQGLRGRDCDGCRAEAQGVTGSSERSAGCRVGGSAVAAADGEWAKPALVAGLRAREASPNLSPKRIVAMSSPMEVSMIRTASRLILSALAAATLVSAVATGPASAQGWDYGNRMRGSLFPPVQADGAAESPNGLAAKKHSQRSRSISGAGVQKELSLSDDQ